MRIAPHFLALLVIAAAPAFTQAAQAEPSGAIGVLGGAHHHRHHRRSIEIHRSYRHIRRPRIALPPGTTRPGRSYNFIPAR